MVCESCSGAHQATDESRRQGNDRRHAEGPRYVLLARNVQFFTADTVSVLVQETADRINKLERKS
jgi:hypothetical protein